MKSAEAPSPLLRRADVVAYRLLAALAALATPVFWFIHRHAAPDAIDSIFERALLTGLCLAIVVVSYTRPDRRLLYLIYFTFYAYTAWVIRLLVLNQLDPNYAIAALVIIATVSVSFLERRPLLWYLALTMSATTLVLGVIPPRGELRVSGLVFFTYLLLFASLAFVILRSRLLIQEKLFASQLRYSLAAQGSHDGLWDWDLEAREIYYSPRAKELLNVAATAQDTPDVWFANVLPEDLDRVRRDIRDHVEGHSAHLATEFRIGSAEDVRWLLGRGLAVRDSAGRARRVAGSLTDITERKRTEERLLHDAYHDALTGLRNRPYFIDQVEQELRQARRQARREGSDDGHARMAVLFLDLDRFKLVNDSLGHAAGDALLREFASRLGEFVRTTDVVARLSGDEFTILLRNIGDEASTWHLVERIQEAIARPVEVAGRPLVMSASIGIAFGPGHYRTADDMLRDADVAMYRAKRTGRGEIVVFDPEMHARTVARLELEADLRAALQENQFRLHYQPIFALDPYRLVGFEALVRWQHPRRGLVPPLEFIGVAEETGLIIPLGRWVIGEAATQLRQWQLAAEEYRGLTMNVNVSGRQLAHPDLVSEVAEALRTADLDPLFLHLEITESVLLENPEAAIDVLRALREVGTPIYLDDFGTGYSSFQYLHQFPVHAVKLDRSFVEGLETNSRNSAIVRTVVALAATLGLQIVAEGVESAAELDVLKRIRCPYGQGFLFSKPLSATDVEADILQQGAGVRRLRA